MVDVNVTNDVFMMEHMSDGGILRAERDYDQSTADDFAKLVTAHRENRDAYRDAYERTGDVTDKYLWVYAHAYVIRAHALLKPYNEYKAKVAAFKVVGEWPAEVTSAYANRENLTDDGGDG